MVRVLVVDDHGVVREGLATILQQHGVSVAGTAGSCAEAKEALARVEVDVVVLDLMLPDGNGIDLIEEVRRRDGRAPAILVFTMHDEAEYGAKALRAGAAGFLAKTADMPTLVGAIRTVAGGGRYVAELPVTAGGAAKETDGAALTAREWQILELFGRGLDKGQVAEWLSRSPKTINAHRENIKKKLGLSSSTEFLHYAIRHVEAQAGRGGTEKE